MSCSSHGRGSRPEHVAIVEASYELEITTLKTEFWRLRGISVNRSTVALHATSVDATSTFSTKKRLGSIYVFSTIHILMTMKKYTCEVCKIEFETFQAKANHVRWKHRDNTEYLEKLRSSGPRIKRITESINCEKCGVSFNVIYNEGNKKHKQFCSRSCANSRGARTEEFKQAVRKKLTGRPTGRKIYHDLLRVSCKECEIEFETYVQSRTFCSKSCGAKHSARERNKKKFASYGFKKVYKHFTKFQFALSNYPNEFNFALIEEHGWYKAKNRGDNLNGISRDHRLSVVDGLRQMINPLLLAHPANCRLLRHNDNVSKGANSSLTLDALLERIEAWNLRNNESFTVEKTIMEKRDIYEMICEGQ